MNDIENAVNGKPLRKECIVCGSIKKGKFNEIQCCCGYSMFPKCDLDMLREAGWKANKKGIKDETYRV